MALHDTGAPDMLDQINRNIAKNHNGGLLLKVIQTKEILRLAEEREETHWDGEPIHVVEARLESQIEAYHRHCDVNEIDSLLPRKG